MNYYEALAKSAEEVNIASGDTSYFSKPGKDLDPRLFIDGHLRPLVRNAILTLLINHLELGYNEPTAWATAYLAGSGVSYQWSASREPADLDCLIQINSVKFRQANNEYRGWSDKEIADEINQGFKNELHPRTNNFMDTFELTFYVNLSPSIEAIKPYAAYSITNDTWSVPPVEQEAPFHPDWDIAAQRDVDQATTIIKRYAVALHQVQNATNSAMRLNAETTLSHAILQGSALFEDIHTSRGAAFGPSGLGYGDYANYRWQAGKRSGIVQAMKKLHNVRDQATANFSKQTYGMELPDAATLIRRSHQSH